MVLIFKQMNTSIKCIPSFYYEGERNSCVQHARLRMHCSHLNEHLFSKNLIDSPLCSCGSIEDTYHFFLTCPLYLEHRFELYNQLFAFRPLTIQLLLFGCKRNPEDTNSSSNASITIFDIQNAFNTSTLVSMNKPCLFADITCAQIRPDYT